MENLKESRTQSDKKKIETKIVIALIVCFIVLLVTYLAGVIYYRSHFLRGTAINGIEVSGKTLDELDKVISEYTITVRERGNNNDVYVEKIKGSDIGIKVVSDSGIADILEEQNVWKWFIKNEVNHEKDKLITYNEEALEEMIVNLKGFQKGYYTKPTDAYISDYKATRGYEIIAGTEGNYLKKKETISAVKEAVCNLEKEIDLDAAGCYKEPTVTAEDESIKKVLEQMNKYVSVTVTYKFGAEKEILEGNTISTWISVKDNKVSLDAEKVEEFVATLRKKYDTIFRTREFETSYGKKVTIDGGDYGWWMNYAEETKQLMAMIEAGESGDRKPVYYQEASQYGKQDYGDTYVEINLTAQHLFCYKDGELVLESDFVSGNSSRNMATPAGVYGITYKERYAMLVGETYQTTVSYWMPFNGDIGLHDATWKTQFGKEFYKTDGSHGCVNLPYSVAKQLYGMIDKGTAVVCYKLSGTTSKSITVQKPEEIAQSAIDAINAIGKVTKDSGDDIKTAREIYNKINSSAKQKVNNYKKLTDAEAKLKKILK